MTLTELLINCRMKGCEIVLQWETLEELARDGATASDHPLQVTADIRWIRPEEHDEEAEGVGVGATVEEALADLIGEETSRLAWLEDHYAAVSGLRGPSVGDLLEELRRAHALRRALPTGYAIVLRRMEARHAGRYGS